MQAPPSVPLIDQSPLTTTQRCTLTVACSWFLLQKEAKIKTRKKKAWRKASPRPDSATAGQPRGGHDAGKYEEVSTGPARRFCHRPLWTPEGSAPGPRNSQTITHVSHNVSLKGEETFLLGPSLPTAGSTLHEMQSPQLVGEQTTVPGCSFRLNSVSSVHHPTCPPSPHS